MDHSDSDETWTEPSCYSPSVSSWLSSPTDSSSARSIISSSDRTSFDANFTFPPLEKTTRPQLLLHLPELVQCEELHGPYEKAVILTSSLPNHLFKDRSLFTTFIPCRDYIGIPPYHKLRIAGVGQVELWCFEGIKLVLPQCYYISSIVANVIDVDKLDRQTGFRFTPAKKGRLLPSLDNAATGQSVRLSQLMSFGGWVLPVDRSKMKKVAGKAKQDGGGQRRNGVEEQREGGERNYHHRR